MIVIQQTKNHLETCLFLNGQQLTDTGSSPFDAGIFQHLMRFALNDIHLHVRSCPYTVND